MNKKYMYLALVLFCVACGNKTKDVDAELKAEADRVNAVVDQIESGEEPEGFVETDNTYIWEKGYLKNEFGEEDKSSPFIKTTFSGEGVRGEAEIEFLFSKTNGLILTIYGCNYAKYHDCVIKVKLGENVDQLIPTDVDGTSILFQDMGQIRKIIELLECGEEFKLSILMKTGYTDMNSSFLFSIYGNTDVKKALASIGIELGYDGNYDYHGEAPDEENYFDPTTLDEQTLMNRVIDESE